MHAAFRFMFLALAFVIITQPSLAGGKIYSSGGKAIEGYDPVAYFTDSKPVKGNSATAYEWKGTTWQFANAANRDAFIAMPEKYAPQYGGHCAWAVSQGYTAGTDPDAWKIVDGKLYLNYSKSIQRRWLSGGTAKLISAGDKNWPELEKGL